MLKKLSAVIVVVFMVGVLALAEAEPMGILLKPLQQGATGTLELSVDRGTGAVYQEGEDVHVRVRSSRTGYLTLFHFDPAGDVQILYPNQYHQDNRVQAGVEYTIPGELLPFRFVVAPPFGRDVLFAVVMESDTPLVPYDFDELFTRLPGTHLEEATAIAQGLELIPVEDGWWAAAMCYFYSGYVPTLAEAVEVNGWGLFVGINRYEGSPLSWMLVKGAPYNLPDLTYCVADAHAMALALEKGFPHHRVLVGEQATRQAIKDAVTGWLSQAPQDATVLVYFAGYGAPVPDDEVTNGWHEALVTYDRQLIIDYELGEWLAELPAGRVVVVVDSSFPGAEGRDKRTVALRRTSPTPTLTEGFGLDVVRGASVGALGLVPEPIIQKDAVALMASQPDEVAEERQEFGHGIFTHYLLEGLTGLADHDGDGRITTRELHTYVVDAMGDRYGQTPLMVEEAIEPVLLLNVP